MSEVTLYTIYDLFVGSTGWIEVVDTDGREIDSDYAFEKLDDCTVHSIAIRNPKNGKPYLEVSIHAPADWEDDYLERRRERRKAEAEDMRAEWLNEMQREVRV